MLTRSPRPAGRARVRTLVLAVGLTATLIPGFGQATHASTRRVSVGPAGEIPNGSSNSPAISGDGSVVAFVSIASDLVTDDINTCRGYQTPGTCADIFAKDLVTGQVELISQSSSGEHGDSWSGVYAPAPSGDGRFVAFMSVSSNLVPGDTNMCDWDFDNVLENCADVFVRDREHGTTVRVSVSTDGSQIVGCRTACATWPSISADGRYVGFSSGIAGLDPDHPTGTGLYIRDRDTDQDGIFDEPGASTTIHIASGGANALSADGRYIAFQSRSALLPEDNNGVADIYVYDRATEALDLASVGNDGEQTTFDAEAPDISADGRWVVFTATRLVPTPDDRGWIQVYARDRLLGVTHLVTRAWDGVTAGNQTSFDAYPKISADGRFVAYASFAWNLTPAEQIGDIKDVFVFDLQTMRNVKASVDGAGEPSNSFSGRPGIDDTARRVVFNSSASNLDPNPAPFGTHVYLRDRGEPTCPGGGREEGRISSKLHDAEGYAGPGGAPIHEVSCLVAQGDS